MKLTKIQKHIRIEKSPEEMWDILSQYGDVSNFHAGVVKSYHEPGSKNTATLGCERVCNIVDMGLNIVLKERIVNFIEGKGYQYEVYEWKNFPLKKMLFGFNIESSNDGKTILTINLEYRASPGFLTPFMVPKMKKLVSDVLLGYKHFSETGEKRVPIKALRKLYKNEPSLTLQHA